MKPSRAPVIAPRTGRRLPSDPAASSDPVEASDPVESSDPVAWLDPAALVDPAVRMIRMDQPARDTVVVAGTDGVIPVARGGPEAVAAAAVPDVVATYAQQSWCCSTSNHGTATN